MELYESEEAYTGFMCSVQWSTIVLKSLAWEGYQPFKNDLQRHKGKKKKKKISHDLPSVTAQSNCTTEVFYSMSNQEPQKCWWKQ